MHTERAQTSHECAREFLQCILFKSSQVGNKRASLSPSDTSRISESDATVTKTVIYPRDGVQVAGRRLVTRSIAKV